MPSSTISLRFRVDSEPTSRAISRPSSSGAFDRYLTSSGASLSPQWFTAFVRQRIDDAPGARDTSSSTQEQDWLPALEVAQEIASWDTQLYRVSGDLTRHFP